ncbi:tetratricopeptide repeat protein, partial [bacterium]|nr:tetratricopeptide repeat protein [bacterium]
VLSVLADIEIEKGNIKGAIDLIEKAIKLDPENAETWFKKSQFELKMLRVAEAKISGFKALELDPADVKHYQLYIEILTFLKQKDELEKYTRKAYQEFPGNSWLILRLSTILVEKRQFREARDILAEGMKLNPDDHLLLFQLATVLAVEGKWEDAITYFKVGLAKKPDSVWAKVQLAKIYFQTGQAKIAIETLETAREEKSKDPFVYEALAQVYNRQNDTYEAEQIILEGLAIDEKNQNLILEYANLLEKRGDTSGAISAYEQALRLNPDNSFILGKLGNQYRLAEDYEKSLEFLDKAIALSPKSTWIRAYRVEVLSETEKWSEALASIDDLLKIMPDDYWAYAKKALIEIEIKRFSEAQISVTKAIALKPDAKWLKEIDARILENLKKYDQAEKAYLEALTESPDSVYLCTRLGYVQVNLDKNKALQTIKKAISIEDFDLSTIELYLYLTGQTAAVWNFAENGLEYKIHENVIYGRFDEAKQLLKQLKESNPHVPFLKYFIAFSSKDKEAELEFTDSKINSVKYPWQHFYLGFVFIRKGEMKDAMEALDQALKLSPDNTWIMVKQAYVFQQEKKYKEAIALLKKFLTQRTESDYSWVQLKLALNYDLAKMYRESEMMYKKILVKKPDDNIALNNLAWMYLNSEDPALHKLDEALQLAKKAVDLQPSSANLDTLAEAYYQNKEYTRALKTIEQALDRDRSQIDDFKKTKKKIIKAMQLEERQKD